MSATIDPGAASGPDDRFAELDRLRVSSPLYDAVIDEVKGRRIRIGDHWLADFASCNYLGFDLDPEIIDSVADALRMWGTHPSWSRLLGNPRPYADIEERLTALLGAPDTLVLPTITHIHLSVIPVLAEGGWIALDDRAHKTVYDGCSVARGRGGTVCRFPTGDLDALAALLRRAPAGGANAGTSKAGTSKAGTSKLICMDGVNSMTGNAPDLAAFAALAREHDALLYVDDAHGFGVLGERAADEPCPYGVRGNSIVRHVGETYDNIILVGGFSKAYSSLLAFLALPTALKNRLKVAAAPYLYSGPSPVASLATVLAGFDVNNARGDTIRSDLYRKSARVLAHVRRLGLATPNTSGLPIIEIPLDDADAVDAVGRFLYDAGIYVTLAAYPLVPRSEVGFRIQVTAANGDDEIDELCQTLSALVARFPVRTRAG
ncbi:MAG TPA: pyridoxal phosphate-dependent aminotransferase family protein [Mycobacteriales bacterium]|nr:pyridoxal phosphate-dependent aminotransferase family protein [Mycobacteriales bacterium]